ncbi:MAG: UTRA domain-containing protein, partial [Propionibacteriaceae bacterium]|nr:UTRA domain-containing protein [Propionibacteriaceae bacterium]
AAVADPLLADLLGVRVGDPLLVLRSVSFDQHGDPMEVFSAYHRGDRSRFEFHLRATPADPAGGDAATADVLTVEVSSIQPVPLAGAPAILHAGVGHPR